MDRTGLFDLERHFAFYGAYHSDSINVLIHTIFVWPILFTTLVLLYFTPALYTPSPQIGLFQSGFLVFNFGFLFTLIYAFFYVAFDKRAGALAALLCFVCWVGASFLASRLGFSLAWKVMVFTIH
jgi:uncharacterized membrane protein YGL010W